MKIFKTEENIESIVSLISNAKEFVVIVSPFNQLAGWDELINTINKAAERNISISYYVRKGEGLNGLEGINVKVFEVPLLHAKMFFSESEAIISSGNLTNRPDLNWTCLLNNRQEYNELINFFDSSIKPIAKAL
ncbi:MAG: hypothetical protein ABFD10_21975 [Prolixibacteraceae bacterium]